MNSEGLVLTLDQIKMIEATRVQLLKCASKNEVEDVFGSFNISDLGTRIALLRVCMKVKNVYGVGDKKLSSEELYDETVAFFEGGQWREFI